MIEFSVWDKQAFCPLLCNSLLVPLASHMIPELDSFNDFFIQVCRINETRCFKIKILI